MISITVNENKKIIFTITGNHDRQVGTTKAKRLLTSLDTSSIDNVSGFDLQRGSRRSAVRKDALFRIKSLEETKLYAF